MGREPVARLELEVNDRRALDSGSYAEGEIGFDPHRRVVLVPKLQQLELVDPFSDHALSPSAAECSHRVEATVELHKTIGMARTTTSAIAEKAGVERLTVYRHSPMKVPFTLPARCIGTPLILRPTRHRGPRWPIRRSA